MPEQERLARARAESGQQRAEEALARAVAEQRQSADEVERLRRELQRYRQQGDRSP